MNSVKVFDLARTSPTASTSAAPGRSRTRPRPTAKLSSPTLEVQDRADQFAAQAYDALHIASQALKKVKLSGNLAADRTALRDALPEVRWTGATGAFQFRRASDKAGKPAGYDAQQAAIVSVTQNGRFRSRSKPPDSGRRSRCGARRPFAFYQEAFPVLEQQLVNALSLGSVYALFALGFTLIFGVLGVVNLSHGAVFMVGAHAALQAIAHSRCRWGRAAVRLPALRRALRSTSWCSSRCAAARRT